MITVRDIYKAIDKNAAFSTAEKWDNCGILAGDPEGSVTKIVTALDITKKVILEAHDIGAELIVSHHPVIFTPRRAVLADSPEGMLLRMGISAICVHTPFDMAICGMNKALFDILGEPLGLSENSSPLEDCGNGLAVGKVYDMKMPLSPADCGRRLKNALGCTVVRYADGGGDIKRIAICSGSGGSMLSDAQSLGADALVTGDVKHDVLVDAHNIGMSVFDCGHYHTERVFADVMKGMLHEAFPELDVRAAQNNTDPAGYIL